MTYKSEMRKLVAAIACRNQGSRLYGKPVQNLDVQNQITVLDNIVSCLRNISIIDEIVLGISEGVENEIFIEIANSLGVRFIIGDQQDVLSRLIQCADLTNATDVFRVTSESPFMFHDTVEESWDIYKRENCDALFLDEIIDGVGYEILKLSALKYSHENGQSKHRSELCTLFIRENKEIFKIKKLLPPSELIRKDLRLTIDYPEDLVVCRILYNEFKNQAPLFNISNMVKYLDSRPDLKALIAPFTEEGYKTMNL